MFLKNTNHLTPSLISPSGKMNSTLKGYLKNNWSSIFYSDFFCKIEEDHFNYLYHRALGIEDINAYSFVIRTLYHFRERLQEHEENDKNLIDTNSRDMQDISLVKPLLKS